jgi:hypothetical protein
MDYRHEKRRVISILIFWAIWLDRPAGDFGDVYCPSRIDGLDDAIIFEQPNSKHSRAPLRPYVSATGSASLPAAARAALAPACRGNAHDPASRLRICLYAKFE